MTAVSAAAVGRPRAPRGTRELSNAVLRLNSFRVVCLLRLLAQLIQSIGVDCIFLLFGGTGMQGAAPHDLCVRRRRERDDKPDRRGVRQERVQHRVARRGAQQGQGHVHHCRLRHGQGAQPSHRAAQQACQRLECEPPCSKICWGHVNLMLKPI